MHHAQLFPNYEKYNDQERKLTDRAVSTLYGNIISRPADDENFVFKNAKPYLRRQEHIKAYGIGTVLFTRWQ